MKTTVLLHFSEAGETYNVKVFRGDDPAKLKAAVQDFVNGEIVKTREAQQDEFDEEFDDDDMDGDVEPEDFDEELGLEHEGRYEPMNPEEVWEEFDPSGKDILHWDSRPGSDHYRIRVFADGHDIVDEEE